MSSFLFFFPQAALLVVAMNLCEMTWVRRLISSVILSALVMAGLHLELLGLEIGDHISGVFLISMAWATYPTIMFSKMNSHSSDWVERLIGLQQTWLRLFFLFWVRENAANINHYELSAAVGAGTLGFACILGLFSAISLRYGGWVLSVQSIISFFLLSLLTKMASDPILLVWVGLLAATSMMSSVPGSFVLRRAETASLGGGLFLGLMILLDAGYSGDLPLAAGWAALFSILGAYSWVKTLPEENEKASAGNDLSFWERFFVGLRVLAQIGLLAPLLPRLMIL